MMSGCCRERIKVSWLMKNPMSVQDMHFDNFVLLMIDVPFNSNPNRKKGMHFMKPIGVRSFVNKTCSLIMYPEIHNSARK